MIPLPRIPGGWRLIISDPSWQYRDRGSRMSPERCADPYETMTLEEIKALPVAQIAAPVALLILWSTDAHLLECPEEESAIVECDPLLLAPPALQVAHAWGFRPIRLIPWVKTGDDAWRLQIGGGHYVRTAHEVAILCARGKVHIETGNRPASVIRAPRTRNPGQRGKHSTKPQRMLALAERMAPWSAGARLEMFARSSREGWVSWGKGAPAPGRAA